MEDIEVKKIIATHLDEGLTLNEIHKILADEHKIKMTFMELRLLSSELEDMDWSKFDPKKDEPEEDEPEEDDESDAYEVEGEVESGTKIEIFKVQRPGAMMGGSVVFLSGIKGEWYVDQFGALSLNLEDELQEPTEEDMQDFQMTLRNKLQG